ncbi:EXOS5 protein, partial [Pachycephala philippinensis]|nr:EXOS5 protein [Pachycephala philippinensis]
SVSPGDTSVLAGLYGPAEAKISKELPDRAALEVLLRPKVGLPGGNPLRQRRLCSLATSYEVLSLMTVVPLLGDDSLPSLTLISATLALSLLWAGVPWVACGTCPCRDPPFPAAADSSTALSFLSSFFLISGEARAILTFAIASSERKVLMSNTKGSCSVEEMQQCLAAAQRAADTIFQFYRDSVRRRYSKS